MPNHASISPLHVSLLLLLLISRVGCQTSPNCSRTCGDVAIPYPFGTSDGCSKDETFLLACNATHYSPPKPFWRIYEVAEVSAVRGEATLLLPISRGCYNRTDSTIRTTSAIVNLTGSPFTYSSRNKLTLTGCATAIYITDGTSSVFLAACASACSKESIFPAGTCAGGIGCCKATIPQGNKYFELDIDTYYSKTGSWEYNPCSFIFLEDQNQFHFNKSFISANENFTLNVPVVLDWSMENENCTDASKNTSSSACTSGNSNCLASTNGLGYLCNCSRGYEGNPYIEGGCSDINECMLPDIYPCKGICTNTAGSYSCECPRGQQGNPITGCIEGSKSRVSTGIIAVLASTLSLLIIFAVSTVLYRKSRKRRAKKLREKFYRKNYDLLDQLTSSCNGDIRRTKIFSLKEMEKATNKFDDARVVGRGGHGTVYKGMLLDNTVVAIKKSKPVKDEEIDAEVIQFINEVAVLSQIDHRNVVRLIGCCLETEIPLLVYEFIANGTLSEHLHLWKRSSCLSWDDRLRIATEIAAALAYMHSAASRSIFHRDLKSANVLLDEKLTAKVSDFGTSKSIMTDQTHITTAVQGTYGYLDPEYFHTGQLTEKSDVYSFGVILLELLTGEKPYSLSKSQEEKSLTTSFILAQKENRSFQLIEAPILEEAHRKDLEAVMTLAGECLKLRGEKRPTMKEVESVLQGLRRPQKQKKQSSQNLPDYKESIRLLHNISITSNSESSASRFPDSEKLMEAQNIPR